MKDRYPLTRKLRVCPHCERLRREAEAEPWVEAHRTGGLPDFLAALRRDFRYEAPFEPVWAEAVRP